MELGIAFRKRPACESEQCDYRGRDPLRGRVESPVDVRAAYISVRMNTVQAVLLVLALPEKPTQHLKKGEGASKSNFNAR